MGKFVKGCAVALLGIVALAVVIMWATSGVAGAADQFIEHLSKGETDQAYALLGSEITKDLSREQFDEFLKGTRLGQAQSSFWSSRNVNNGKGDVSGTVSLAGGGELKVQFILRKESGNWVIQGIQFPKGLENEGDLTAIKAAAQAFLEHAQKAEYQAAYDLCGESLKKDADLKTLSSLLENNRLKDMQSVEWTSTEGANIGERLTGLLTLTDGTKLKILLVLQESNGKWLVEGLDFKLDSAAELPAPELAEIEAMAERLRAAFAGYMDDKTNLDMAKLCEPSLAAKIENGALDGLIAQFPDRAVMRRHMGAPVVFFEKPTSSQGKLKISVRTEPDTDGYYFLYVLDHMAHGGEWKLYNIDLKMRVAAQDPPPAAVTVAP